MVFIGNFLFFKTLTGILGGGELEILGDRMSQFGKQNFHFQENAEK